MFVNSTHRFACIGLLLLQIHICTYATIVIKGNSKNASESFTHPIKAFATDNKDLIFIGTHAGQAKDYALAVVNTQYLDFKNLVKEDKQSTQEFAPLAPRKATVNGKRDAANPLYNSTIKYMTPINQDVIHSHVSSLAVVTAEHPTGIYLIEATNRPTQILAIERINDAAAQQASSIINMTASSSKMIYAAVTDSAPNSQFGEGHSGIAIITEKGNQPDNQDSEKKESESTQDKKPDPENKECLVQRDYVLSKNTVTPQAFPLNNKSNVLRIGKPVINILNNAVNFNMIANADVLYIALCVHAQGNETEGAQGIVIGSWDKTSISIPVNVTKIDTTKQTKAPAKTEETQQKYIDCTVYHYYLKSITNPKAFVPGVNNIVGCVGTDSTVSIHQTKNMSTSTLLDYLVVLGGVGKPEQTRRTVYALPVVRSKDIRNWTLAKKGAEPVTNYAAQSRISGRVFTIEASNPGDLYTADDIEVQVGHGPMTEGDIHSIMVYGDSIYAIVNSDGNKSGIYQSQAIFDRAGCIKEWTKWRRVYSGFAEHLYGAALNQATGTMVVLTGDSAENLHTVKRTLWESQPDSYSSRLTTWLDHEFPQEKGGIQGLFDFPIGMPGLKGISLLCATGNKQFAIAQTGIQENNFCIPLQQQELATNPAHYSNGTIDAEISPQANAIALSGGELDELSVIKAATITCIGNAGYIFVGGTKGLAILANDKGYSFDASEGLGNNLSGLYSGTTCKKIGSYSFIRKLICDHDRGLLYVVSDTQLDRIDLHASNFITGDIAATTLLSYNEKNYGMLFDAVISRSFGIIATSKGLYCTEAGTDIRTAQNATDLVWQRVDLPDGLPTVRQLFCVTVSGNEQDITTGKGGNLYVLNTDKSKQKAQVYRFTINTSQPDYYTLELLPDFFVKDVPSYFAQLSNYRTWIYSDGALFFSERDKHSENNPILTLLAPQHRGYQKFGINNHTIVPIDLKKASILQPILRSSASGAWLLAQNTMLTIHE